MTSPALGFPWTMTADGICPVGIWAGLPISDLSQIGRPRCKLGADRWAGAAAGGLQASGGWGAPAAVAAAAAPAVAFAPDLEGEVTPT